MNTVARLISKDWIRLAGIYEDAVNAVRIADYDTSVTDEEYSELVDVRERAFAKLQAQSERDHGVTAEAR